MKSYNPFKMFGSYIGLIVFIWFGQQIFDKLNLFDFVCTIAQRGGLETIKPFWKCILMSSSYSILFYSLVGFLIGWGIHSLISYILIKEMEK